MDSRAEPIRFVIRAAAITAGAFGALAVPWIEAHLVWPVTRAQGQMAAGIFGVPSLPVEVTLACSGADAMALCLGAILAYPGRVSRRLAGAAGGLALVLALNVIRIGTLGLVVSSPSWFAALHLYVWPAILTLAIAAYVFAWIPVAGPPAASGPREQPRPLRQFATLIVVFVVLGAATAPLYADSARLLEAATFIARTAAWLLRSAGADAAASANVLWTARGGFLVTQECVTTPLIPVYLAAVCAFAPNRRLLAAGALAAVPLFAALAVARLLVAALPSTVIASPPVFIHAFNQLLLAAVVVTVAAVWRHGRRAASWRAPAGVLGGLLFVYLLGPSYLAVVMPQVLSPAADPQRALAFLPPFQAGFYLALSIAAFAYVGTPRLLAGFVGLALTHTLGFVALHSLVVTQGWSLPVAGVRAWAVAGPLLMLAGVVAVGRPQR